MITLDLGLQIVPDALHIGRVQVRRGQRIVQQLGGEVGMAGEGAHRAIEAIPPGGKIEGDGIIGQHRLEGFGIARPGPLVQHAGDEMRQPRLARRIERNAALEGKGQRQDRQAMILDEPDGNPARAGDLLYLDRGGGASVRR